MATMDNLTLTGFIIHKLATKKARRAEIAVSRNHPRFLSFVKLMMHIAGFSCLTIAGFKWSIIAGFVIAGISCFALSWLLSNTSTNENGPTTPRMR